MRCYTGLQRSGKTYNAVKNIVIPAVISNRNIFTNIPLCVDIIKRDFPGYTGNITIVPRFTIELVLQTPAGYVLIIDEAYTVFPAGLKNNPLREKVLEFLAHAYHYVDTDGNCIDITILFQSDKLMFTPPIALCEARIHHKKLRAFGMSKRFKYFIHDGPTVERDNLLNTGTHTYVEKYWRYYKSQSLSNFQGGIGNEKAIDSRGNILKNFTFIGIPVLLLSSVFIMYPYINKFFHPSANNSVKSSITNKQDSISDKHIMDKSISDKQVSQNVKPKPTKPVLVESSVYRYAGENINSRIAYIEHVPSHKLIKILLINCTSYPDNSCNYNNELVTRTSGLHPDNSSSKFNILGDIKPNNTHVSSADEQ